MSENPSQPSRAASPPWERTAVALVALYYLGRLLWFALSIGPGIPPDEDVHAGLARLYAGVWLFPGDSPASYRLGLVSHVPFLYHFVLGKLLVLDPGIDPLRFLRLLNVGLAMAGFACALGLARALASRPAARVLFLVLLTNTLMLTFLGASVNYDNGVQLAVAAALWCAVRHMQTGGPRWLAGGLAALAAGLLVKLAFAPFALLLLGVWSFDRRRSFAADLRALAGGLRRGDAGLVAGMCGVVLLGGAAAVLYGGNLVRFGAPVPSCEQVLPLDACLQNRIYARNYVLERYQRGETSFEEAVAETAKIHHRGDRRYAISLLRDERVYKARPSPTLNRFEHLQLVWDRGIKPTLFGIQAHRSMLMGPDDLLLHNLVFVAFAIAVIRGLRFRHDERFWVYLAVLAGGYVAYLVSGFLYASYVRSHSAFMGVQGRYVAPALVPAYLLAAEMLLRPLGRRLGVAVMAAVAAVFVAGDLPYFLRHASAEWYTALRESVRPPGR